MIEGQTFAEYAVNIVWREFRKYVIEQTGNAKERPFLEWEELLCEWAGLRCQFLGPDIETDLESQVTRFLGLGDRTPMPSITTKQFKGYMIEFTTSILSERLAVANEARTVLRRARRLLCAKSFPGRQKLVREAVGQACRLLEQLGE